MPDNLNLRRPIDLKKINLGQAYEVSYWTLTLGISPSELRRIVGEVGNNVEAVKTRIRLKNIVHKLMAR